MFGKKVSQSQCAEVFGVHRNTIAAWLRQGCPFDQKANKSQGLDWVLDTAQVAQWREEKAASDASGRTDNLQIDIQTEKARLAYHQANLAELDEQVQRGKYVDIVTFEKVIADAFITIRQRMMNVPQRVTPLVVGLTDEMQVKKIIDNEVRDVLTELSEHEF